MSPPLITRIDKATGRRSKIAIPGLAGAAAVPRAAAWQSGARHRARPVRLSGGTQAGEGADRAIHRRSACRAGGLDARTIFDTAVALAELPDQIRGFGPVKDANRAKAQAQRTELLAALSSPRRWRWRRSSVRSRPGLGRRDRMILIGLRVVVERTADDVQIRFQPQPGFRGTATWCNVRESRFWPLDRTLFLGRKQVCRMSVPSDRIRFLAQERPRLLQDVQPLEAVRGKLTLVLRPDSRASIPVRTGAMAASVLLMSDSGYRLNSRSSGFPGAAQHRADIRVAGRRSGIFLGRYRTLLDGAGLGTGKVRRLGVRNGCGGAG